MTIAESLYFVYDGIDCRTMGVSNVNLDSGLLDDNFLPQRELVTVSVRGRSKPYLQDRLYRPLQLSLKFAFDQAWNEAGLRKTARWLCQDYYKPLYFSDNPNRIYYTMYKDNPRLLHNALKEGYIDIVFDNIGAYTYSPVYEQIYKLNANSPAGTNLALTNSGDVNCFPILEIQMVNGGSFTICNLSHKGEQFTMTGLADGEKLYIDSETEEIRTDLPLTYRYGNVAEGSVFPKLVYGKNTVNVKGNIELKVKMQYRTLQG